MIDISLIKLNELLVEVEQDVEKNQKDYNRIKKALEKCSEELQAKKNLKFSIERIIELKQEKQ